MGKIEKNILFQITHQQYSTQPAYFTKIVARSWKVLRIGKRRLREARVEKHPEALTESLSNRLPVSMLRMFFKRNEVDAMLSGFATGRSKSKFMPCKGAICEIFGLARLKKFNDFKSLYGPPETYGVTKLKGIPGGAGQVRGARNNLLKSYTKNYRDEITCGREKFFRLLKSLKKHLQLQIIQPCSFSPPSANLP